MTTELTDEQIGEILDQSKDWEQDDLGMTDFARAIIAAHEAQRPAAPEKHDPAGTKAADHAANVGDLSLQGQAGQRFALNPDNGMMYESDRGPWCLHKDAAPPAAPVPEGFKRVPMEPTPEMLTASYHPEFNASKRREIYTAMLAASPDYSA